MKATTTKRATRAKARSAAKRCDHCGKRFTRPADCGDAKWRKRRYCGPRCNGQAAAQALADEHELTSAEVEQLVAEQLPTMPEQDQLQPETHWRVPVIRLDTRGRRVIRKQLEKSS